MKKMQLGESKAHRFFSGKGFYVALAVSLVAVGGAAWLGVNSAINKLENDKPEIENNSMITDDEDWGIPSDFEANAPQSNIPADTSDNESEPVESEPTEKANSGVQQGYILPLKGDVLNEYSGDKMVKSKTLDDWVMHTGLDIAAEVGTPVKAMSAGKITEIKNDDMWGTTITITHDGGIESYYANLKASVTVKEGQSVKLGDVIGNVGETADIERAEESHLHFGVRKDGEWVDPMSLIA